MKGVMKMNVLVAKDLCKTFTTSNIQQHVLKNLNVEIKKGDFTIIMGSSGSGKSTLLYALSGIDRPTLGSISYNSEEISGYSNDKLAIFRRNHCGFVFQQNYLNDNMSVMDNILVAGLLSSKNKKELIERATKLLKHVDINEESFGKYPTQLSGGEAQRVAVVRGVISNPEILFADEPTGALNSMNTKQVLDVLSELNSEGQSIVMVTHDVKSARRGNRILYLKDGIIVDELDLGKYVSNDQERHKKLRDFLLRMGW